MGTLVFQGRRDTVVDLIPDAGHCAPTKLPYVMATIADWLVRTVRTISLA
jgi:esterase FrsA